MSVWEWVHLRRREREQGRQRQIREWDHSGTVKKKEILATCMHSFSNHLDPAPEHVYTAVPAQPCLFLQRMLIPGAFLCPQIAVLNYRCREWLLFLRATDRGEATKEAVISHRLQTPVVLWAVNTSLFTAGNGSSPWSQLPLLARDLAKSLTITSWAQLDVLPNYKILCNDYYFFTIYKLSAG